MSDKTGQRVREKKPTARGGNQTTNSRHMRQMDETTPVKQRSLRSFLYVTLRILMRAQFERLVTLLSLHADKGRIFVPC